MFHSLAFDTRRKILLLTFLDVITEASYTAALAAARQFIERNDVKGMISDSTKAERFDLSGEFIRQSVLSTQPVLPGRPLVIVAPANTPYGLARLLQAHRNSENIFVVRTMGEAYALLQVDNPHFSAVIAAPE